MKITHLYTHNHFHHSVQITGQTGSWVEFLSNGSLFWLEEPVFLTAYTYKGQGQPITVNLSQMRAMARESHILVPEGLD